MQLIKRLGPQALPVTQTACTGPGGFNCSVNLTVTAAPAGGGGFEALLVNHPTGVVNMRSSPYLPPVTVTVTFGAGGSAGQQQQEQMKTAGRTSMPATVSVRRVDATHANALPAYEAMGRPPYPNGSAIAALKAASALTVEPLVPKAAGTGGAWSVTLQMPIYSVATLSF
eukprot:SAG22_NODE_1091_length_5589_cov_3.691439_3_plen_170_part_00